MLTQGKYSLMLFSSDHVEIHARMIEIVTDEGLEVVRRNGPGVLHGMILHAGKSARRNHLQTMKRKKDGLPSDVDLVL